MSNVDTQFKPGHAPTPGGGRPKNAKDKFSVCELKKQFKKAAKAQGEKSFYAWLAKQAFKDNTLAIALLRKIIPDMKQVEIIKQYEGGYAGMSPSEACEAMDAATVGEKPDVK